MAKTKPNTYKSINNNRILTCGTRDKACRQTVSRDSRGRKKSLFRRFLGRKLTLYRYSD